MRGVLAQALLLPVAGAMCRILWDTLSGAEWTRQPDMEPGASRQLPPGEEWRPIKPPPPPAPPSFKWVKAAGIGHLDCEHPSWTAVYSQSAPGPVFHVCDDCGHRA